MNPSISWSPKSQEIGFPLILAPSKKGLGNFLHDRLWGWQKSPKYSNKFLKMVHNSHKFREIMRVAFFSAAHLLPRHSSDQRAIRKLKLNYGLGFNQLIESISWVEIKKSPKRGFITDRDKYEMYFPHKMIRKYSDWKIEFRDSCSVLHLRLCKCPKSSHLCYIRAWKILSTVQHEM